MGTIDIAEVRRRLERYAVLSHTPGLSDREMLVCADLTLAYLPMLLDELERRRWTMAKWRPEYGLRTGENVHWISADELAVRARAARYGYPLVRRLVGEWEDVDEVAVDGER